jgi:electron transfer flavoprotein alpha subunit
VIAVVPVRRGELPAGADEAVAEAGGRAVIAGEGAREAASSLAPAIVGVGARSPGSLAPTVAAVRYCELGTFQPGRWASGLAGLVAADDVVLLPASPDGRDLAPRLAAALRRPLFAGALAVSPRRVDLVRLDGKLIEQHEPTGAFVATLVPGSRAAAPDTRAAGPDTRPGAPDPRAAAQDTRAAPDTRPAPADAGEARQPEDLDLEEVWIELGTEPDAELVEIVDADPAVVDLAEAQRVVAGGAGLTGDGAFDRLAELGRWLHASVGATRVVTDAGLVSHERQIGTTGVSINPRCYVAFGISGAAQHVGGIGDPEHIVAANLDASCPMMAMADLALVTDAAELVEALLLLLEAGRA